ncbi:hypothetical protein [Paracoccus sp. M683]|nr:hypothetical protein [Paracoccus sp. M683]
MTPSPRITICVAGLEDLDAAVAFHVRIGRETHRQMAPPGRL